MKKRIEILAIISFLAVTIAGLMTLFNLMTKFGYDKIGESVLNIAKLTSASVEMTDAQLEELMNIDYKDLPENEVNMYIENTFKEANLTEDVAYVYVIRKLEEDDVKYTIDDEEQSVFFGEVVGTKLDYIWLLDYIVNDELREQKNSEPNYYDDIYRYTTVDPLTNSLYKNRETTFFENNDEWDNTITGYAPFYTVEGTYIGLMGVDVFVEDYNEFKEKVHINALIMGVLLGLLLLGVLSFRYVADNNEVQKDKLSGLYTRKYYEKYGISKLKGLRYGNKNLTVVMLDIDEFKRYNDFYGHMRGDVVISTICKIIKSSAESFGACAGRFGGEEFIIIAPNISVAEGDMLCEKIRKDVEQLNIAHDNGTANKFVTVSIGAVTVTGKDNKMTLEEIIESADAALYNAKHSGRNRYIRSEK